ncbi:hypothetical protein EDC04DRAFT_2602513 [Pisolithus marmoratus]|nr:hypothetical protein EDC04DRAFT_2602513 [Pisolithus marmoratus]
MEMIQRSLIRDSYGIIQIEVKESLPDLWGVANRKSPNSYRTRKFEAISGSVSALGSYGHLPPLTSISIWDKRSDVSKLRLWFALCSRVLPEQTYQRVITKHSDGTIKQAKKELPLMYKKQTRTIETLTWPLPHGLNEDQQELDEVTGVILILQPREMCGVLNGVNGTLMLTDQECSMPLPILLDTSDVEASHDARFVNLFSHHLGGGPSPSHGYGRPRAVPTSTQMRPDDS